MGGVLLVSEVRADLVRLNKPVVDELGEVGVALVPPGQAIA